jgi:hypothetical protein
MNWMTVSRSINSTLGTFVSSNATYGSSLYINKAGIWSITFSGTTGDGTLMWVMATAFNDAYLNPGGGTPVLASANSSGSYGSNFASCSFTGFLPSNVYIKPGVNGEPEPYSGVWRFVATFLAETDAVSGWLFA